MNWLRRMMAGRYGSDTLCYAMLGMSLFLLLLDRMTNWSIFWILSSALLVVCYLRMFSRNVNRRYEENQKFLQIWNPLKGRLLGLGGQMKDAKTHRFLKCPSCGQKLRVPRGKGKLSVTCPKCGVIFLKKT